MTRPIKPSEVGSLSQTLFPAAVFDAFNAEIAMRIDHGVARVYQPAVIARMESAGLIAFEVISNGWLNVEDAYRDAGWKVSYHKPGYNEQGSAYFEFRQPLNGSEGT